MTRHIGGSLLPSSASHILQPITLKSGVLQVRAIPELDTHGLFHRHDRGETCLAQHPNGYACHELAKRLASDDTVGARQQVEYILDCGGLARNVEHVLNVAGAP